MKALSLDQPYASALVLGIKKAETRGEWGRQLAAHAGTTVLIHATKRKPTPGAASDLLDVSSQLLGAIVGAVTIDAVVPMLDAATPDRDLPFTCYLVGHGGLLRHQGGEFTDLRAQLPWGNWAPGRYAIEVLHPEALPEPVQCTGHQRVWNVPADVEAKVVTQLRRWPS